MAYFAALLVRTPRQEWSVRDCDLDELEDLGTVGDLLRKAAVDEEPVLLLCEQEDVWFAVARVEGAEDPRVFVSDAAVAARTSVGALLLADAEPVLVPDPSGPVARVTYDEEDEPPAGYQPSAPVGDSEVVADCGMPAEELLELCSGGLMPADALFAIAERAGCAEALESVR